MSETASAPRIVVAISGASGSIYGLRLIEVLLQAGCEVHFTLSNAAIQVFQTECQLDVSLADFKSDPAGTLTRLRAGALPVAENSSASDFSGALRYHPFQDYRAGIASGSFKTAGMVVCPCSMGTLASIANGLSTNLLHRAADVHLKERRKLIVVPRETPLGSLQLQNMQRLSEAGAVILPAMPGFYHRPQTMLELVDFIVTRICDQLGIDVQLTKRWGSDD